MIYLVITNRPKFLDFALAQMAKCPKAHHVILANGPEFKNWKGGSKAHFFYNKNWRYNSDAFNWFRLNFQKDDHLFLMDDDIYLKGDSAKELEKWIEAGWDRVVYTRTKFFDCSTGQTHVGNWRVRNIGGGWAISKDIWRLEPWPERPVDAMLRYFNDLPCHDVKQIPIPKITHLIHDQNVVLKRTPRMAFDTPNDAKVVNEVLKYGIK